MILETKEDQFLLLGSLIKILRGNSKNITSSKLAFFCCIMLVLELLLVVVVVVVGQEGENAYNRLLIPATDLASTISLTLLASSSLQVNNLEMY